MNIHGVEMRTGLTRANIRFYESRGLLEPPRKENGYREYSDSDVETLKRIKLLRQLRVPVDTIRSLQTGGGQLRQVIEEQLGMLAAEKQDIEKAQQVCLAIRDECDGYGSLDAQRYLDMYAAAGDDADRGVTAADRVTYIPHPWRRFWGRYFDMMLYWAVFRIIMLLFFKTDVNTVAAVLSQIILMFVFEPVFLHFWGTTPGKWIMNIRIRDVGGEKLSYEDALIRTWQVFRYGNGYCIPGYNIYRSYRSYCECGEDEMPWDAELEYECGVYGGWRTAAMIGGYALTAAALTIGIMSLALPPRRGPLSIPDFAANYNYYAQSGAYYLGADGEWKITETEDGEAYLYIGAPEELVYPEIEYTVEDGRVTGISYSVSSSGQIWLHDAGALILPVQVLMLADRQVGLFSSELKRISAMADEFPFLESTTVTAGGVRMTWTAESDNVYCYGRTIATDDGESGYISIKVTAEKI